MARRYRLYFVRHLTSTANEKRQYAGWTDCDIVKTERRPIDFLSAEVHGSDLKRTRQTAEIYFPNAEYHADPRWRECNFGVFEGKTYEQLKGDAAYRGWIDDPWQKAPQHGETLQQVKDRALEALYGLENNSIVVTHGGIISILLHTFSKEPREFWQWRAENGSVWKFEWADETDWKEGKKCRSLSEVPITAKPRM